MEFSIKNYYNIQDNLSNKEIIDIFINDLEENLDTFQRMINEIKSNPNFIYPQNCFIISKKVKYWIVIICILLEKITNNPIYILNAETFYKNEKISTLDTFFFFLRIINEELDSEIFDKLIFSTYFEIYNNNLNLSYRLCLEQMLKIDQNELKKHSDEKLINLSIK